MTEEEEECIKIFEESTAGDPKIGNIITIVRSDKIIFECIDSWYVPRIGETIALAKWDTVYTVVDIFTVFGKSPNTETVTINVEIKK